MVWVTPTLFTGFRHGRVVPEGYIPAEKGLLPPSVYFFRKKLGNGQFLRRIHQKSSAATTNGKNNQARESEE